MLAVRSMKGEHQLWLFLNEGLMCSVPIQHPDLHILPHCTILHTVYFSSWSRVLVWFRPLCRGSRKNLGLGFLLRILLSTAPAFWLTSCESDWAGGKFLQDICMKSRLCAVRHKHKAQRWWQAVASCVLMWVLCSRSVKIQTWERSDYVSCPHSGHRHCAYPLLTFWSNLIIDPWIPNTPLNNIVLLHIAKAEPER